jgi:hypothetical protein
MKNSHLLSLVVLASLTSCARPRNAELSGASEPESADRAEVTAPPASAPATPPDPGPPPTPPCVDACAVDGDFALRVSGAGFSEHAGRTLGVSAMESPSAPAPAAVLLARVASDGTFQVACAKALSENYTYPSYGVWLDVDGDGKCGARDLVTSAQFYGWTADVEATVSPQPSQELSGWSLAESTTSWGSRSFCEFYAFPR